jgi:transposase-like protein
MLEMEHYACPNPECPDHGERGKGNIGRQSRYGRYDRWILRCKTCKTRFSQTTGTPLHDVKLSPEKVELILKVTAEGVGVRATGRITGVSKDAVNRLILKVGEHCEKVLRELLRDLELTELQLDELWSFIEKKTLPTMKREMTKSTESSGSGPAWRRGRG